MTLRARPAFHQDVVHEQLRLLDRAGAEVAEAWRVALLESIEFLKDCPLFGRERKDLRHPGIRSWRVNRFERWLIFCGVRDNVIIPLRVISGTMDLPQAGFP